MEKEKMTYHIPFCVYCNEREIGSLYGSGQFCSEACEVNYHRDIENFQNDERDMFEDEADYYESWRDEQAQDDVNPSEA
jgi:hypothetical protein